MKVGLLDYGSGNLHSAANALVAAGADVVVSSKTAKLRALDALVVPGVGAFAACMAGLRRVGGDDLIWQWVAEQRPLLGICVGHQVLFAEGHEHGVSTPGLGIYPGIVTRLAAKRLPHMGWNTVSATDSRLFSDAKQRYYFVHSYAAQPMGIGGEVLATHESTTFVAAMERGALTSTQFHPEKSGRAGRELLVHWLRQGRTGLG